MVYNHTGEGDWQGPTLSFRGLDNASYYRLAPDGRSYVNDTGTGNTMNTAHPMVQRLVLDSLRYWAGVMGVDGFRFDLGTVIGREAQGFDPGAALLDAIRQDPLLAGCKMIFEPWDIGHGGYQLGGFPPPFAEWNDIFRDTVRRFWRGDDGEVRHLAGVVAGSAAQFDWGGRPATSSVNLVTAHDGFTLMDVVSYDRRHNEANGEDNQDGHAHNSSDNMGHEGPTDDPKITTARLRRRRNMLATLMLSQGTPMLLAGDEFGNSQGGNNNAYAQDNETGWLDWPDADPELADYIAELTALRRSLPMLRQARFLHSQPRDDGHVDLVWRRPDGGEMTEADWEAPDTHLLCAEIRMAAGTPDYAESGDALYLIFNQNAAKKITLSEPAAGTRWQLVFSSVEETSPPADNRLTVPPESVLVLKSQRTG